LTSLAAPLEEDSWKPGSLLSAGLLPFETSRTPDGFFAQPIITFGVTEQAELIGGSPGRFKALAGASCLM